MNIKYNGMDLQVDIDFGSEPEDSFVIAAYDSIADRELTEAECDALNDALAGEIYDEWVQSRVAAADFWEPDYE